MNSVFAFLVLLGISVGANAGPSNMILASETGSTQTTSERYPESLDDLKEHEILEFPNLFSFHKTTNPNNNDIDYFAKTSPTDRCTIRLAGSKDRTSDVVALTKALKWKALPGKAVSTKGTTRILTSQDAPNDYIHITCDDRREGRSFGQIAKDMKIKTTQSLTIERISADSKDPNLKMEPAVLEKQQTIREAWENGKPLPIVKASSTIKTDGFQGEGHPPRPRPGQPLGTR